MQFQTVVLFVELMDGLDGRVGRGRLQLTVLKTFIDVVRDE